METNKFRFKKIICLIFLLPKLGFISIFKVLLYRILIKIGFLRLISKSRIISIPKLNIINLNKEEKVLFNDEKIIKKCTDNADLYLRGDAKYFYKSKFYIGSIPNWFFDPKEKTFFQDKKFHWTECKTFRS